MFYVREWSGEKAWVVYYNSQSAERKKVNNNRAVNFSTIFKVKGAFSLKLKDSYK